jgi:hypothetical protein
LVWFCSQGTFPAGYPRIGLRRGFRPILGPKSVILSWGTPLGPYGSSYRRTYGLSNPVYSKITFDVRCVGRDSWWLSHQESVRTSVGTTLCPYRLPTVGTYGLFTYGYSRNPFAVRCFGDSNSDSGLALEPFRTFRVLNAGSCKGLCRDLYKSQDFGNPVDRRLAK